MALRQWSSEIYTAEFRELQASTFCCSRDGRLGLLAGTMSSMSVVFFPVASNHPWYSNISTRKEKSWPSLYGAAQRTGETNRKEQQVTFSLSLSSVDLCLCQQIHLRWEVGAGQWNPSQQFGNHIALCCNDKASFNVLHVVKQSFKKKDLIISLL